MVRCNEHDRGRPKAGQVAEDDSSRGPDQHAGENDRPPAPGAVDQHPARDSRGAVGHGLQGEEQADLRARQPQGFLPEDRKKRADGAPSERGSDQPDDDGYESRLGEQGAKRLTNGKSSPRRLARAAGGQAARNGEDEQRGRHRQVGPDIEPVQQHAGDRRADEETRLHREREPSHRAAEPAALHRLGHRGEQRRLLGAATKSADDLPDEQREDCRCRGGRQLRARGDDEREDQQRSSAEAVDKKSGRQREKGRRQRAHREERTDLESIRA